MKRNGCVLLLKQIMAHIRGKREKYNLTVPSNSYWSPFLLSLENIINCVSVYVCVCECECAQVFSVFACACTYLTCVFCLFAHGTFVRVCAPVIFWQSWHGAPLQGPKKTHIVTLALHSTLFTLGQNVLNHFLCSIYLPPLLPPPLLTSRSPSLSLIDPRCGVFALRGNHEMTVWELSMFANGLHACICVWGFSSLTID